VQQGPTGRFLINVRQMKKPRTAASKEAPKPAVDAVREAADALFRAARECCHQHDRASRIVEKSALEEELASAHKMCEICDDALRELTAAYEKSTASFAPPNGPDEGWWHTANELWLASKQYLRRHSGCDAATKQLKNHGPQEFAGLQTEYELEASALLALRHAAEAYQRERPIAA
jgi:hypothetical protein